MLAGVILLISEVLSSLWDDLLIDHSKMWHTFLISNYNLDIVGTKKFNEGIGC